MKIDGNSQFINPELKIQQNEADAEQSKKQIQQSQSVQDRLEFSTASRDFQELQKRVHDAPEVRAERVAAIKEQLEAGTYNIKAEKVADAIITGAIVDKSA